MILCFMGSRTFEDKETIGIIEKEIEKHNPEYIVEPGDAAGVCAIARLIAKRDKISLKLHFLNQAKYARGKYHHRSLAVLQECDHVVFIHEGTSKGTINELTLAKELKS